MRYVLLILLLGLFLCMSAQSGDYQAVAPTITPVSPNVASLMKYTDYPVSHYTGVPSISIPLYSIIVDNVELPIALNYHSSGIRVDQEASWVGLGWSLMAGGNISRVKKGFDDFSWSPKGYYYAIEADEYNMHNPDFYKDIPNSAFEKHKLSQDSEPDIFHYSLPNASGKFLIDKKRGVVFFDKSQMVKIAFSFLPGANCSFTITTPDGTRYEFSDFFIERSTIYSEPGTVYLNYSNTTRFDEWKINVENGSSYISSWFLRKIITPKGKEILFDYEREEYISPAQETGRKFHLTRPDSGGGLI